MLSISKDCRRGETHSCLYAGQGMMAMTKNNWKAIEMSMLGIYQIRPLPRLSRWSIIIHRRGNVVNLLMYSRCIMYSWRIVAMQTATNPCHRVWYNEPVSRGILYFWSLPSIMLFFFVPLFGQSGRRGNSNGMNELNESQMGWIPANNLLFWKNYRAS